MTPHSPATVVHMTETSDTPTLAQTLADLQAHGLARIDAQMLLLQVLGVPLHQRGWLLAHDSDLLPVACAGRLLDLAKRRLAGEPLAYLTGSKAFYGLDLRVTPDVLVPRPDTETLVDWALDLLAPPAQTSDGGPALQVLARQTQANNSLPAPQVLDLGTGSGAIALALKANRPELEVWATDQSPAALAVAQGNAQRLGLSIEFAQGAWLAALPASAPRFDCIVSNPPYIADGDAHLPALRFEPSQALTSGADGLHDLRQIVAQAPFHLLEGGWLLLEHGYDQAAAVRALLAARGFAAVQSRCDLAGVARCSGGQWPQA
jgi:release factor glutamine methyltransferase